MAVSGKLIGDPLFSAFPLGLENNNCKEKESYCTSFPASALNYDRAGEISHSVAVLCSAGQIR